jgi:hypothetical protein
MNEFQAEATQLAAQLLHLPTVSPLHRTVCAHSGQLHAAHGEKIAGAIEHSEGWTDNQIRDEVAALLRDIHHLEEMKRLEENPHEKSFHVVPISGLVIGFFMRIENELKTVLELWDGADLGSTAQAKQKSEKAQEKPEKARRLQRSESKVSRFAAANREWEKFKAKRKSLVFGLKLSDCSYSIDGVSQFVSVCVQHLRERGLHTEGLFRISAAVDEIEHVAFLLDAGKISIENTPKVAATVHSVAALLKKFLRELKHSLVPQQYLHELLIVEQARLLDANDDAATSFASILSRLPPVNRATFRYLFEFLFEVTRSSEVRMDATNIATIFGPAVFRDERTSSEDLIAHTQRVNAMFKWLLDHADQVLDKIPKSTLTIVQTPRGKKQRHKSQFVFFPFFLFFLFSAFIVRCFVLALIVRRDSKDDKFKTLTVDMQNGTNYMVPWQSDITFGELLANISLHFNIDPTCYELHATNSDRCFLLGDTVGTHAIESLKLVKIN